MKYYIIISFILLTACMQDINKPSQYDGSLNLTVYVELDVDGRLLADAPVSIKPVRYCISTLVDTTDSTGAARFENLPWDNYMVKIQSLVPVSSLVDSSIIDTLLIVASEMIEPEDEMVVDTLHVMASGAQPGLKINELYTVGPPNSQHYFFDQFMELYNSTNDTLYLDGLVICRIGHYLERVTYIFQFPGEPLTGREYPVPPGGFVVLAQDAYDHALSVPLAIDLTNADWEFRNSNDYADFDNPDVPNIDNIEVGHRLDFMISLTMDVVLIADGTDVNYLDGMDMESVIDCVEYASFAGHIKDIEAELDRGFGG
ncbi:MAG: DUF4876 domain-containing protein, partial [Candidatus Marinimicrobia bacterium]|nr:DUF4876 domain-containing protein [Candidatus Neomarinimicrobiota bacterium]